MYTIPIGYYTFCCEFFMPDISKFQSINCLSSVLNVNKQTTKKFSNYTRSIINFRKGVNPYNTYNTFLDIDLHLAGDESSPNSLPCYMIVYGVKETSVDVDSKVFDSAYIFENQKMVMQTSLDMNNHAIINSPSFRSSFVMSVVYNKTLDQTFALFSGVESVVVPANCKIVKCCIHILDTLQTYPPIYVTINNSIGRGTGGQSQTSKMNVVLLECNVFRVRVLSDQAKVPSINKCLVSLLLETR